MKRSLLISLLPLALGCARSPAPPQGQPDLGGPPPQQPVDYCQSYDCTNVVDRALIPLLRARSTTTAKASSRPRSPTTS